MACYLQLTTEEYLYICILDGVWGSKTNKLARWQPGDQLIVYVDLSAGGTVYHHGRILL